MVGRTPEDAVEAFIAPLRAIMLCVTRQPFVASGSKPSLRPHVAAFAPQGAPVSLHSRFGRNSVALFVGLRYRLARPDDAALGTWTIRLAAYDYAILDRDGRESLVYHWHPEDLGPDHPHLHLPGVQSRAPATASTPPFPLGDLHLPTGHVSPIAIVRLLIEEFGVPALRSNWASILAESEETMPV